MATNKRSRDDGEVSDNMSAQKRHYNRVDISPFRQKQTPNSAVPRGSETSSEVISLLDDDYPPISYHNSSNAIQGSQQRPYEIEDSPPPNLTMRGAPSSHSEMAMDYSPYHTNYSAPHIPNTSGQDSRSPIKANRNDVVPITEPELCEEQANLVNLILSGRNVFYTGSAGCGKSTVLAAFVRQLRERGKRVHILAPTGRAALQVNGTTTWSYAGWVPSHHKKPLEELKKGAHQKFVYRRLTETDVLVIDEISMVENLHFERLNEIMKEARGNDLAFGGVQLIVTGDFCQLPPVKAFGHCITCGRELIVNRERTEYRCRMHGTYYDKDKWAFKSRAWKECSFTHVNLTMIHRQSDTVFIELLQKLRLGRPLTPGDMDLLLHHPCQTRNAVKLFGTRQEVSRVNDENFRRLPSSAHTYMCLDHFKWNEKHRNLQSKGEMAADGTLKELNEKDHRYNARVQLKKGMLVVLLANIDIANGLVNGAQGTIQGFVDHSPENTPKAARKGKDNEIGGGPVLTGEHAQFREQQIKDFMRRVEKKVWPEVQFLNGLRRVIHADCTVNELGDEQPYSLLSRTQIPLVAGYALTTHKSQGMTLNRVEVDLSRTFEAGQAYVALSRARSLDGLKVISFPPNAQSGADAQVKAFLKENFGIE